MTDICAFCESCPFDMKAKGRLSLYEIHVTVETSEVQRFKDVCLKNGIKPIVIEFQNYLDGSTMTQVMTSQRVDGNYFTMKEELNYIVETLETNGFKVIRRKVETMPEMSQFINGCYFESHLGFKVRHSDIDDIKAKGEQFGMYMSKNAFKKEGDTITVMGTIRDYGRDAAAVKAKVIQCRDYFIQKGYQVEKMILEYCIIDSKIELDKEWMGNA